MNTLAQDLPRHAGFPRVVSLLLNIAHGIDHMFLLIFATERSSCITTARNRTMQPGVSAVL